MPAYKNLLQTKGINYNEINTIEDFKTKVPIITKKDLFTAYDIADLCVDGNIDAMKVAMSSSGFSENFSFGINFNYLDKD